MSNQAIKTNNDLSLINAKIQLRINSIENLNGQIKVLELFGGEGILWNEVKKITGKDILILGIDKNKYKRVQLQGDNLKFMDTLNLNEFDIIDADAWGSPFYQVDKIFAQNYKGIVHCTFIQTMMGALSKEMLLRLGYTESMLNKVQSLFNKNGIGKFKNYLARNGVKEIFIVTDNKKNYLYFNLDK
jgi:tRNA G26 N,N-dimethylase Trm1